MPDHFIITDLAANMPPEALLVVAAVLLAGCVGFAWLAMTAVDDPNE